ncbi:MAG: glycosyltransferase [Phormidesmis sp.]
MRLLWITERFPPDIGGVARSSGRIVRSLTALGISVDVVTWSRYLDPGVILPPEASPVDNPNVRVHRIGLYRNWDMTMPHTLNLLDWLHTQQSFDGVWGHYLFPAGFVAAWFAKMNGLFSVVSARGNDIDRGMFPPGDFARLQWTLANATAVTAVSQEMAKKVETLGGGSVSSVPTPIAERRVVNVLPNVVDVDLFHPSDQERIPKQAMANQTMANQTIANQTMALKERLGILPEESVLGFSGELREKKGQRFLLQALSDVRAQRPACLLIMGELRPESQVLLQQFSSAHPDTGARVIVTSHLDTPAQVAEHLRLCDVYLQPSLWDGMPNALLEAMACGCGCIGSDAGGISEVIEHGVTGFIVARSHLHRLGEATLEYLKLAPHQRAEIGHNASEQIATRFTLAREQAMLKQLMVTLMPDWQPHERLD